MITNLAIGRSGRLGNQIFQYAILKCISLHKGYEIVLPKENSEFLIDGRYNPDINGIDKYKLDLFDCFELDVKTDTVHNIVNKIQYKYKENFTMDYDTNLIPNSQDHTNYDGFYQCIQYYISFQEKLKKDLIFKKDIQNTVENYLNNIKKQHNIETIVTVHVRRGDLASDNGKYQVLLSNEYYKNLIDTLKDNKTKFLLLSDNIEWCKENIKDDDIIYCDINKSNSNIQPHILDFCTLSNGDKIIMSSSSFSWWAAFLSNSKEIYCPNRWFGSQYTNFHESNIRHPNWIKIQYKGLP